MAYVDGFVIPIPKKNLRAYQRMARDGGKIWRDHGALDYWECVGEDLDVKMGRSFSRQLRLRPGETVVFSWIVYKSRAHRDRVNAKVMKDPRMGGMDGKPMPFDVRRMCYGGFEPIVELRASAGRSRTPRARPAKASKRPADGQAATPMDAAPAAP